MTRNRTRLARVLIAAMLALTAVAWATTGTVAAQEQPEEPECEVPDLTGALVFLLFLDAPPTDCDDLDSIQEIILDELPEIDVPEVQPPEGEFPEDEVPDDDSPE